MPILSLTVATAIVLGAGANPAPATATKSMAQPALSGVAAELNAVDRQFVDAFQKEDIEGVMALYTDDAVVMDPGSLIAKGKDEIRRSFMATFAALDNIKLEITDGRYDGSGDVGYSSGLFVLKAKDAKNGGLVDWNGRATSVFVKKGGKWLYKNDHASVPQMAPITAAPDPAGVVRSPAK